MTVRDRSAHVPEGMVVARLHDLASHLDGEPDPGFRATTRARLVAMAAVRTPEPAPTSRVRRLLSARAADAAPSRWRTRLTAGLTGAALGVTAVAAVVAVAAGAGPGDLLYDVKRGTEQTHLALAGDSRGQTLLGFASTRLEELQQLTDADAGLVVSTLGTMDDQTTEGASWLTTRAVDTRDSRPLDILESWAGRQASGLATLRDHLTPAAADEMDRSLALLSGITARTTALRTSLNCPGGPATKGSDSLGPVPAACPTATPGPPTGGGTTTGGTPLPVPPGPGSATAPPASPPAVPPVSGVPGGGSGTPGNGGLPVPGVPGVPDVPGVPSLPTLPTNGSTLPLPTLPLPGAIPGSADTTGTPSPKIGIDVCLPPLATIGDC